MSDGWDLSTRVFVGMSHFAAVWVLVRTPSILFFLEVRRLRSDVVLLLVYVYHSIVVLRGWL